MIKIRKITAVIVFSVGKCIAASGQTLFGMQHALSYCLKSKGLDPIHMPLLIITTLSTFLVIVITRIPAIYRQFFRAEKNNLLAGSMLGNEKNYVIDKSKLKQFIFHFLVICGFIAGAFSAFGSYLGTITINNFIIRFLGNNFHQTSSQLVGIQCFAILVAISTFISFYTFNFRKTKQNVAKLLVIDIKFTLNSAIIKTFGVSLLSLVSTPFLAYFLTKHALYQVPHLTIWLPEYFLKAIATLSSLTALIASLTTNVPATHEFFSKHTDAVPRVALRSSVDLNNREPYNTRQNDAAPLLWTFLKRTTYTAGFGDSIANGLANFMSVLDVAFDAFNIDPQGLIIIFATFCGISSAILNANFSIRQGFQDFAHDYQKILITSTRAQELTC